MTLALHASGIDNLPTIVPTHIEEARHTLDVFLEHNGELGWNPVYARHRRVVDNTYKRGF